MNIKPLWQTFNIIFSTGIVAFFCVQVPAAAENNSTPVSTKSIHSMQTGSKNSLQREPFELKATGVPDQVEAPAGEDKLERAILLLQDKEYAEALPLLEDELKRIPTVEAVWEGLGWAYYGVGRVEDAKTLWQQYAALRPDSPKAHSLLAQLAILRSDWRAADLHLSAGLQLDPENFDIRYWYAQNLFRLGRLDQAVAIMEKLVQEDDMRYDVRIDLARVYTLLQNYEESLELWEEIVDVFPDNLDYRTEYARILMLTGGLDEADEQARRILAEDPDRMPVMMLRADVAELSQLPEIMVQSLQNLIEQAEDNEIRAQLRIRLAARYLSLNSKDEKKWPLTLALEQYDAATEAVPHYVPWLNQYASVALLARRPEITRRITDRILEDINPYNQQALRNRFELEMLKRNYDAAEYALDDFYDLFDPDNPYRFYDRARIEVARGKFFNAMDELDKFEAAGHKGALLTLLYHGLTESEWMALTSTRRLQDHLMALREAGYSFIPVSDIPAYLKGERPLPSGYQEDKPWLARQVDNVRYAFTGHRQHKKNTDLPPEKIAVVTFDDGLRTSFRLGTTIAEDLQIPFWMAVITHIEELNALVYAAWEEIRSFHETGLWEIGSHTMRANTDKPAGPEPSPPVATLPNKIWLPERNRLETLREWSRRVRNEFEDSREMIEKHLNLTPGQFMAVAYPYSEIGQSEGSNVARLINPVRTILNEASRVHSLGFVVDERGYTTPDDNIMMIRRYEPDWDAEAEDILEHALMTHPVMMARRLRAEIAVLSDRPYLAEEQIKLLRRDGYPDKQLRRLAAFSQNRAVATQDSSAIVKSENNWTSLLKPSNLYLAASYHENQSNEEIRQRHRQLRGGLNINPRFSIEGLYRTGDIKQTVTSNVWYTVRKTERSSSTETRRETVNGVTTVSSVQVESTTTREVQTNRVDRYKYSADIDELRGTLNLRITDNAYLGVTFGEKTVNYARGAGRLPGTEKENVGSLAVSWRPYRALTVTAIYDRDLVPSARKTIPYNGLGLGVLWKVRDSWELNSNARYASYKDKNSMLSVSGGSFWELIERQGIWGGVEAAAYTMDDDSDLYWSPYWDTRYAGVLRLRRSYPLYFFQFDLRLGQQKEKGRPEDVNEYRNLKAQAEADGTWDPGEGPGSPLSSFIGLNGTWRQRIWKHFDLFANGNINFLRDYSEHDLSVGIQLNF